VAARLQSSFLELRDALGAAAVPARWPLGAAVGWADVAGVLWAALDRGGAAQEEADTQAGPNAAGPPPDRAVAARAGAVLLRLAVTEARAVRGAVSAALARAPGGGSGAFRGAAEARVAAVRRFSELWRAAEDAGAVGGCLLPPPRGHRAALPPTAAAPPTPANEGARPAGGCVTAGAPLTPLPRTKWTRLVPPSILTGHVSSLPRGQGAQRRCWRTASPCCSSGLTTRTRA